jgi:NADH:ubiquinone oxidoreductase subunit H
MNNWWINAILALLFWPGLLSGALFGWFLLWMSRKFIARLQGRQGLRSTTFLRFLETYREENHHSQRG